MPKKNYPDDDSDLLFFESYGIGFDMLFMGTWQQLNRNINLLKRNEISKEIIDYASLTREQALENIPKGKEKPKDWKPNVQLLKKFIKYK